jgi:hypothetical protein
MHRGGVDHLHLEQLRGTLAGCGDALGQVLAYGVKRRGKSGKSRCAQAEGGIARLAVCHDYHHVVRARVAVDPNHVARHVGGGWKGIVEHVRRARDVGDDKGQHGGHVGVYHARPLGYAGKGHGVPAHVNGVEHFLGHGVGGHDALGSLRALLGAEKARDCFDGRRHLLHGQLLSEDPCGRHDDILGDEAKELGRYLCHGMGVYHALGPVHALAMPLLHTMAWA